MNDLEKQLLQETVGAEKPSVAVRARTRLDTGLWWWTTRAWVCVVGKDLVMLAVSRRRYVARVPLDDCTGTYYCQATSELVVEPAEDLMFSRFRMSPKQALEVLTAMGLPQWEPVMAVKRAL